MANINLKKNEGAKSAEQLIQELNDIKDLWQEDQDSRAHKYAAADAAADIRTAVKGTAIEKEANRILNGDGAFLESVKRIIALLNKSEDNDDKHRGITSMNTISGSKKHEGLVDSNGKPITARTWDSGNIDGYSYQALVFPEPSDYGINNGNISKLSIKTPDGKLVVSYDRGWDIEPVGKVAKAILDKVRARYAVEQSSETKCNEAFAVYRGGPGYSSSFMIDCGSPERAKALADAIAEEAYEHPLGSAKDDAGRHFLGGEIVQFWPVDRYFTATVDPCDKAIEWCQEFLKNLDGEISALTGNDAGLESIKNESILSSLLEKNPVWNEIGGGDTAALADSIEKGEWIGLMTGAEDDTDAGWDKYLADTFGPFADFVESRYIKPDESTPDFRVAQIKFKPLFNRLSTNAKTGLLADLGDVLKGGYFAERKDDRQNEYFPQGGIAKHWNGGHWYERNYVSDRRLNTRIRLDGAEELIRVGGMDPIHATRVLGKALAQLHPRLANGVQRFTTMVHDYVHKKEEPSKNYVCDMVRELLPKAIPAIDVIDVKTAWRKDPDGISEGISPKLALRKKLNTVDGFLKDLPCFHDVLGRSAKDLYDKGFDLDVAGASLGDKAAAEKEAKRAFDDFDEYIDYSITSEKEDGKDYWYALVKFKPAFWDLADSDLHDVLKLLNDAISEYC